MLNVIAWIFLVGTILGLLYNTVGVHFVSDRLKPEAPAIVAHLIVRIGLLFVLLDYLGKL